MSRRRWWYSAVGIIVAVAFTPMVRWYLRFAEFAQEQQTAKALVRQLRDRRPANVDADRWEVASGWVMTAYCNVCFSLEHVALDEMRAFRADLEEQFRGPVDLGTLDWLWDRLGRTGPHGKLYCEQYAREFREAAHPSPPTPPAPAPLPHPFHRPIQPDVFERALYPAP